MDRDPRCPVRTEERHRSRRADEVAALPTCRIIECGLETGARQAIVSSLEEVEERERSTADPSGFPGECVEEATGRRLRGCRGERMCEEGEATTGIMGRPLRGILDAHASLFGLRTCFGPRFPATSTMY